MPKSARESIIVYNVEKERIERARSVKKLRKHFDRNLNEEEVMIRLLITVLFQNCTVIATLTLRGYTLN